jgi:hypothetical protein
MAGQSKKMVAELVVRVTQDKFEVVLEVSKCVRSTKTVAA